jgi:hypothetical protein
VIELKSNNNTMDREMNRRKMKNLCLIPSQWFVIISLLIHFHRFIIIISAMHHAAAAVLFPSQAKFGVIIKSDARDNANVDKMRYDA